MFVYHAAACVGGLYLLLLVGTEPNWRFGSVGNVVGRINEVNQRQAQLVLGWVTVCRQVIYLGR